MNNSDLHNQLRGISQKVDKLKDVINNEESTKHAFVLPFINMLGYDTFDPTEVVPEFTADIGLKKGEKVDYAILQNGIPSLIIECKHWKKDLNAHDSQLFRYFHTTRTRFALLTNGIEYKFYTDLDEVNKMDEKPFLEFDIRNLKDNTIKEIEKFHKSRFNVSAIVENASNLKYTREVKDLINSEIKNPSKCFAKIFASKIYKGRLTSKVMDEFTEIVGKAMNQTISEKVNDRLNAALNKEVEKQEEENKVEEKPKSKVVTTEEEVEGYQIALAILRRKVGKDRIAHRDTQSYFGILLDNNNRKPICRLHLDTSVKYISVFDKERKEIKEEINSVDDIFKYENQLLDIVDFYDSE